MVSSIEANKNTLITIVEVVLMKRGNIQYNSIQAKLNAKYNIWIHQCIDHPEYLKEVLKEVYPHDYYNILDEISMEADRITDFDKFKANFFKTLSS